MSAAEIEQNIAAARSRLSHDLAALDREYALRNLFVHGLRMTRDGTASTTTLVEAASRNIVPLGLIGIGFAWLMFAGHNAKESSSLRSAIEQIWRLATNPIEGRRTAMKPEGDQG